MQKQIYLILQILKYWRSKPLKTKKILRNYNIIFCHKFENILWYVISKVLVREYFVYCNYGAHLTNNWEIAFICFCI